MSVAGRTTAKIRQRQRGADRLGARATTRRMADRFYAEDDPDALRDDDGTLGWFFDEADQAADSGETSVQNGSARRKVHQDPGPKPRT